MKTDAQLKQEVVSELNWKPWVNAAHVIELRDRIVTLPGHGSGHAEKLAAGRAVQRLSGVKALVIITHRSRKGPMTARRCSRN